MSPLYSLSSILFLVYAFGISNALEFAPTPTWATLQTPALGFDNLPTITAAAVGFHGDLKGRDSSPTQNPICGWISGNGASAVSCGANFYCATESSFVGCCATSSCAGIVTKCYDLLGSICDATCQHDIGNLVCSSTLPYCATYNYPGGSVGYGCAVARGYTVSVLLSTTTSDGGSLALTTSPTAAASSTSTALPTSTTPVSSGSKKKLGGGPIAGIVIGSIGGIALLAALLFLLFRTRRKHREEIQMLQQQQQLQQLQQQQQQNPYPLQDRSGYPSQQYPTSPGGYYVLNKDLPPGSPPLSDTVGSPYSSNFVGTTPRNSYPPNYTGPTIAEVHGEDKFGRSGA